MKKLASTTYSKMYMVSPGVYNKLLNCIDDVEKKETENLNKDKTQKPDMSLIEVTDEQMDEEMPGEVIEETQEPIGGTSIIENQTPQPTIIEPENNQPDFENSYVDLDEIDPQIPGPSNNITPRQPKMIDYTKPTIPEPSNVITPRQPKMLDYTQPKMLEYIENTPTETQTPQKCVLRQPCAIQSENQIQHPLRRMKVPPGIRINNPTPRTPLNKEFFCDICGKGYTRSWGLKRHKKSVHQERFEQKIVQVQVPQNVEMIQDVQRPKTVRVQVPQNIEMIQDTKKPERVRIQIPQNVETISDIPKSQIVRLPPSVEPMSIEEWQPNNFESWENIPLYKIKKWRKKISSQPRNANQWQPNNFESWENVPLSKIKAWKKINVIPTKRKTVREQFKKTKLYVPSISKMKKSKKTVTPQIGIAKKATKRRHIYENDFIPTKQPKLRLKRMRDEKLARMSAAKRKKISEEQFGDGKFMSWK